MSISQSWNALPYKGHWHIQSYQEGAGCLKGAILLIPNTYSYSVKPRTLRSLKAHHAKLKRRSAFALRDPDIGSLRSQFERILRKSARKRARFELVLITIYISIFSVITYLGGLLALACEGEVRGGERGTSETPDLPRNLSRLMTCERKYAFAPCRMLFASLIRRLLRISLPPPF